MPTGLTMDEVVEWALSRGFVRAGGRFLAIPYKDAEIRIETMARNIRVSLHRGGREAARLASVPPSRLRIDEEGLLQGAGLSNSFLQRCRSAEDVPPWYPEAAAARAGLLIEEIHGRLE